MNRSQALIFIFIFFVNQTFAQSDTVKYPEKPEKISPWIFTIPSALISYGIITRFSPALQNFDDKIDSRISQNIHRRYTFDDYIQYLPYAGIYGLDLCGVKAKHNILDRTLVLSSSMIFCTTAVQIPKRTTHIIRPDGSNEHSFPSGHTATAFLGAHILFREYKEVSPWIGIAGYGVAATTGVMRAINRKHWFSDIVTGAGIGIISVELSYLMLPVWEELFKLDENFKYSTIKPLVNQNSFELAVIRTF
jgi:membrane-associated phospholipid phosphatase